MVKLDHWVVRFSVCTRSSARREACRPHNKGGGGKGVGVSVPASMAATSSSWHCTFIYKGMTNKSNYINIYIGTPL
jgi:hypothetical protein